MESALPPDPSVTEASGETGAGGSAGRLLGTLI